MMLPIKTIMSNLKVSIYITYSITALPTGSVAILVIMSGSTFHTD